MAELLDIVGQFLERVGPGIGFAVLVLIAAVPIAKVFTNSRARVAEGNAAIDNATAAQMKGMSDMAMLLLKQNSDTLQVLAVGQTQHNQTLDTLTKLLEKIGQNYSERGKTIIEHMGLNNQALETVINSAATAAENAAAAKTTIDSAVGTGSPILKAIDTFTEQLKILTDQIKESGEVDDKLRADILAQMTEINALLTRSEAKEERAKEKQDEKPDKATPTQTTIELKGEVVGLLNTADLSGDKPGSGTG